MNTVFNEPAGRAVFLEVQSPRGYIHRQAWTNPLLGSLTAAKTGYALVVGGATLSTFDAQPDFPRCVSLDPGGTTADVKAGNYVVNGTNIRGETISDTVVFADNATAAIATVKAFKTVTSIVVPAQDGGGGTWDVGYTDALGLDRCMSEASVMDMFAAGVRETTAATITFHATDVSKNTVNPNSSLDGAVDFSVLFISTELTTNDSTTS